MKITRLLFLLSCCGRICVAMGQNVPAQINYQGFFADALGNALPDGAYTMAFRIYTNESSGNPIWGPQMFDDAGGVGHAPSVQLVGGRCNVVLGPYDTNSVSLLSSLNGTNRYLQVSVGLAGSVTNIIPRQLMLSAPYALKAANADQLAGFGWEVFGGIPTSPTNAFIAGTRIQSASITINQIATAAVGSSQIATGAVSGDKLQIPLVLAGNNAGWLIQANNSGGPAVSGVSSTTHGVFGQGPYAGVYGASALTGGIGVRGEGQGQGVGVYAEGIPGLRAFGTSGGSAAEFFGNVTISGTMNGQAKFFKIDHPLAPAHKYLIHASVESPEMKNIYDGVLTLDNKGEATVTLPAWFGALNKDFRYQLTAIGTPGPNLHIAEEISNNRFRIGGGTSGMKVSWQVTGIRHDAWAEAHPLAVEEIKSDSEKGTYLAPEEQGKPVETGLRWKRRQENALPKK